MTPPDDGFVSKDHQLPNPDGIPFKADASEGSGSKIDGEPAETLLDFLDENQLRPTKIGIHVPQFTQNVFYSESYRCLYILQQSTDDCPGDILLKSIIPVIRKILECSNCRHMFAIDSDSCLVYKGIQLLVICVHLPSTKDYRDESHVLEWKADVC